MDLQETRNRPSYLKTLPASWFCLSVSYWGAAEVWSSSRKKFVVFLGEQYLGKQFVVLFGQQLFVLLIRLCLSGGSGHCAERVSADHCRGRQRFDRHAVDVSEIVR